jgi:hypothetical protein
VISISVAASSDAGIVTSIASIVTAVLLLLAAIIGFRQVTGIRKQGADTNSKLDLIHSLVNSTLTASIESDLSATKALLLKIQELVAIQKENGIVTSPETYAAMAGAEVKVSRLEQEIADRLHVAQQIIDDKAQAVQRKE